MYKFQGMPSCTFSSLSLSNRQSITCPYLVCNLNWCVSCQLQLFEWFRYEGNNILMKRSCGYEFAPNVTIVSSNLTHAFEKEGNLEGQLWNA